MKIEITNRQKIKKIRVKQLTRLISKIGLRLDISHKKISVVLCDNPTIKKINKKFLGHNYATDVITFPLADSYDPCYLGEIIVSVEQAVRMAAQYSQSWEKELLLYVIHGMLHLLGYNDQKCKEKKTMEKKQEEILGTIVCEGVMGDG